MTRQESIESSSSEDSSKVSVSESSGSEIPLEESSEDNKSECPCPLCVENEVEKVCPKPKVKKASLFSKLKAAFKKKKKSNASNDIFSTTSSDSGREICDCRSSCSCRDTYGSTYTAEEADENNGESESSQDFNPSKKHRAYSHESLAGPSTRTRSRANAREDMQSSPLTGTKPKTRQQVQIHHERPAEVPRILSLEEWKRTFKVHLSFNFVVHVFYLFISGARYTSQCE